MRYSRNSQRKKGYAKKIKKKSNFVAIPSKKRNNHGLIVTTLENKNLTIMHWGFWPGSRRSLSFPTAPGFKFLCACLSSQRCFICSLGLQGVQWAVGLVVVRASWPGHSRKSKKKKKEFNHYRIFLGIIIVWLKLGFFC